MIRAGNAQHMGPKALLVSVLSCLRYGYPLVVNCGATSLSEAISKLTLGLEATRADLFRDVASGAIKTSYDELVTSELEKEHKHLERQCFNSSIVERQGQQFEYCEGAKLCGRQ